MEYANTIVMSQTVFIQPCHGAIHEVTCHFFIYAAPGATRRYLNEKSESSNISAGAGKFLGCEGFLTEFPQTCPKQFWATFCAII